MENIQGRDTTLHVFLNGQVVRGFKVKSFEDEADQEMRKRDLIGEPRTQNQLMIHGYKGTFEVDVEDGTHHAITDFLNQNDLIVSHSDSYTFAVQVKENYRDGTSARFRYVNVKLMVPKNSRRGRKDDVTAAFEWHAEDRVPLTG